MTRRRWRWLVSAVVIGLLVLLLRRLDLRRVVEAIAHADQGRIALAVALNLLVNFTARAERWRSVLRPLPHARQGPSFRETVALLYAAYTANNLLPARPGEALRIVELRRHFGYPVGALVAAHLFEKLIETLSLMLLGVPALLATASSRSLGRPLAVATIVVAIVVVLLVLVGRPPTSTPTGRSFSAALGRFRLRLGEALRLLGAPRVWLRTAAWSLVSDLVDVTMVGLCARSLGIHLSLGGTFAVFALTNLAITIPTTPGQVGVHEAGTILALRALGVDANAALSFAVVYHAVHLVPVTIVGLAELRGRGNPTEARI